MALVIEDGTPSGGNTFIDVAFLDGYLSDRGYEVTASKEPLLIRSFDEMIKLPWKESHSITFTVTESMKKAQAEIAYRLSLGFNPASTSTAQVKKEKIDVLEVEYFEGGESNVLAVALGFISDLIGSTDSTVGNVELVR